MQKTAVVINVNFKKNRAAWEDFQDILVAQVQEEELSESVAEVRRRLPEDA